MKIAELVQSMPRLDDLDEMTRQYFDDNDGRTLGDDEFYRMMLTMRRSLKREFKKTGSTTATFEEFKAMKKQNILALGSIGFQACQLYQLDGEIRLQAMEESQQSHRS